DTQFFSEAEKTSFWTKIRRVLIESWSTHRAQEHGSGTQTGIDRVLGQRIVPCDERGPAHLLLSYLELMAERVGHYAQKVYGFAGNFRADSIAGVSCNLDSHGLHSTVRQTKMAEVSESENAAPRKIADWLTK